MLRATLMACGWGWLHCVGEAERVTRKVRLLVRAANELGRGTSGLRATPLALRSQASMPCAQHVAAVDRVCVARGRDSKARADPEFVRMVSVK